MCNLAFSFYRHIYLLFCFFFCFKVQNTFINSKCFWLVTISNWEMNFFFFFLNRIWFLFKARIYSDHKILFHQFRYDCVRSIVLLSFFFFFRMSSLKNKRKENMLNVKKKIRWILNSYRKKIKGNLIKLKIACFSLSLTLTHKLENTIAIDPLQQQFIWVRNTFPPKNYSIEELKKKKLYNTIFIAIQVIFI